MTATPKNNSDTILRVLTGIAGVLALAVVALLFFVLGRETADSGPSTAIEAPGGSVNSQYDYDILNTIREILADDYYNQANLDDQTLYEASINGLLSILSDSGTYYVDPTTYQFSTQGSLSGVYNGIGVTITGQGGETPIEIVAVKDGGPASQAGIVPGDIITAVGDESTDGLTSQQVQQKIRGDAGTDVTITIRHADQSEQVYTLTRAEVELESVYTDPPANAFVDSTGEVVEGLAYIRITEFSQRTDEEMQEALQEVIDAGAKGLILDIRSNPGGNLDATVTIADMFLDEVTVLIQRNSNGEERVYSANDGQLAEGLPIVVLINRFSASAPELLSAALQDNGRATIVGETSFGKATINIARDLPDGGALFVSIAQWLSPNGSLIDQVGVRPDIEIIPTDEDIDARRDVQLIRAVDVLKGELTAARP